VNLFQFVVSFAHILPNYYYIVNNERISYLTDFSFGNLSKIFSYMGIQLLFAAGLVILALIITKKQSKQEA
jgi:ABC-2 type transport system permease protein